MQYKIVDIHSWKALCVCTYMVLNIQQETTDCSGIVPSLPFVIQELESPPVRIGSQHSTSKLTQFTVSRNKLDKIYEQKSQKKQTKQ